MHGRARGRRIKKKSSKPGTAFIHHALDDHSRLTYSEILDDERNETVCAFWQRANAYFASCGITVKRVLTDNGSAYRSRQFADTLGPITHKRTRPYRPRTNGNVERFNRTQEQEWAYAHPYRTESEGVAAFPAFLHTYNHHRGHHAPRRRQPTAYPTPPDSTPRITWPGDEQRLQRPDDIWPVQEKRYTQMPPGESLWGCQRSAPIASTCREEAVAHPGSPLLSSVPCVARRAVAIRDRCDRVGHWSRPRARRGSWGRVRAGTSATMGDGSARGCEHSTPGGRREPNPSRRPTRRRPHSISDGPTTIGIGLGLAEESRRVLPVLIARPGPVRTALVGRTYGRPVLSVSCDGSARCRSGLRDVGGGRAESCDRALDRAFHGTRIQAADVRHHQRRLVESCPGAENCHR